MSALGWEHPIYWYNELGEPLSSEAGAAIVTMGRTVPNRASRRHAKSECACLLCGASASDAVKAFAAPHPYICDACAERGPSA